MRNIELQRTDLGSPIFSKFIEENIFRGELGYIFRDFDTISIYNQRLNDFINRNSEKIKRLENIQNSKENCIDFIFKQDPKYKLTLLKGHLDGGNEMENVLSHLHNNSYIQVLYPESNDIAIYYDYQIVGKKIHKYTRHYGRVSETGSIIHKFGNYDIFESATADIVPNCYGNRVCFVRAINQSFPSHTPYTQSLPI